MRIAIGGISHETATFIDTPTTLADFEAGFGLWFRQRAHVRMHRKGQFAEGRFHFGAAGAAGYTQ